MTVAALAGPVEEVTLTRGAWDEVLRSDPDSLVTQSPAWIGGVAGLGHWRDASRMFETAQGRVVVPMLRRRGSGVLGGIEASFPHAYGFGGIVSEAGVEREDVAGVLAILASEHPLRISIRPNPLHDAVWRAAAREWITVPRCAHIVDLSGGSDAVWERMHVSARRGIRRSEREEVEVVCDSTGASLSAFFDLVEESRHRWAAESNEPAWLARMRASEDSLAKWRALTSALDGHCRVYSALWKGELVAGTIVLFGPNAHYTRGAMRKELAGECRANYALHWRAISDAVAAGFRWYTMGESGSSSSLSRFKAQFGASAFEYAEYRKERVPISAVDRWARSVVKRTIGFREAT